MTTMNDTQQADLRRWAFEQAKMSPDATGLAETLRIAAMIECYAVTGIWRYEAAADDGLAPEADQAHISGGETRLPDCGEAEPTANAIVADPEQSQRRAEDDADAFFAPPAAPDLETLTDAHKEAQETASETTGEPAAWLDGVVETTTDAPADTGEGDEADIAQPAPATERDVIDVLDTVARAAEPPAPELLPDDLDARVTALGQLDTDALVDAIVSGRATDTAPAERSFMGDLEAAYGDGYEKLPADPVVTKALAEAVEAVKPIDERESVLPEGIVGEDTETHVPASNVPPERKGFWSLGIGVPKVARPKVTEPTD